MEPKLVIFDLDGVLVDACEWHRLALNRSLKEVCNYEISIEQHYSTFNGIPTKVKLSKLSEMGIISVAQHQEIYDLKQQKTMSIIKEQAKIRPEKIALIQKLQAKGIHVACFTNSIRETTTLMLCKTGILDLFELIITNQDVKEAKPSPEGYLKTIQHFNVEKESVIIVEDSPKGIAAARATGCRVIEVSNPDEVHVLLFKEYLT
jgi:HAD superfamily hydrolase (TIGR01509 family)